MKIYLIIITILNFIVTTVLIAQTEKTKVFQLSLGAKYLSRFTAYGIDLAEDKNALSFSSSIAHNSGLSINTNMAQPIGNGEDLRQWTLGIGYDKEVIKDVTLSAEYSHYFYNSDTVNILSSFSDAISFAAEFDLHFIDVGVSIDQFLGGSGATYFGIDFSTFVEAGSIYILPIVQTSFISQTIEDQFIAKLKGRKKESQIIQTSTTSFSGLASTIATLVLIYPLGQDLYASVIPIAIWSHQEDLVDDSFRFVWSIGIRYRLSF